MSDPWFEVHLGASVLALQTTCEQTPLPYGSFNLGLHVGDDEIAVVDNRQHLTTRFGSEVYFPEQVHGIKVVRVTQESEIVMADAVVTNVLNLPIGVLTADCLPVLFASDQLVGVAHAGWRGLASGVLENTLDQFANQGRVRAWLGPCIGLEAFEVGPEVLAAFLSKNPGWTEYFKYLDHSDRVFADLSRIASNILENRGVDIIERLDTCTYNDQSRWYSFRRSRVTGRMASCIMRTG
ncbi:MAG: hypothetical protein CMD99_04275 [Gammaproteobacteria bacterium]|nr:hypothetical protein [Gammaproteobacteria bacterium]